MYIVEDSRAPNPRRVRIFLAEKGLEIERRNVDLMAEEHKTPEMLAFNPFARLPFLVLDDGLVIAETMAICRYFDAMQPEPKLFGDSPEERGLVEMWQRRMEFNLFWHVSFAFRHGHPKMAHLEHPQIKEWGEANVPKAKEALEFLNNHLESSRYIAGEAFSVADITALCAIDFMRVVKLSIGDHQTSLRRWHEQVSSRPSAKA